MKRFNLTEYLKNPSRKVVTRNGKPVRILCTDFKNKIYPVLGAIDRGSIEDVQLYTVNGEFSLDSENEEDIYLEPVRKEGWINVFIDDMTIADKHIYETKEDAFSHMNGGYLKQIKVEWEE